MITRDDYLKEAKKDVGEREFKDLSHSFDNEYYSLIEKEIKDGNTISQPVYDSLADGQKYHFNKHYNHEGNKVQ